jgi:hypothetical protein
MGSGGRRRRDKRMEEARWMEGRNGRGGRRRHDGRREEEARLRARARRAAEGGGGATVDRGDGKRRRAGENEQPQTETVRGGE